MITEQWRQIPNYPYELSSLGRLRNSKLDIVKPGKTKTAGHQYKLQNSKNSAHPQILSVSVSRLMAGIYADMITNGYYIYPFLRHDKPWEFPSRIYVRHINDNIYDNSVTNLILEIINEDDEKRTL